MDLCVLNTDNLGYSVPRKTSRGYNVLVNYAGKKPITIKTPVMSCPYGVDVNYSRHTLKLTTEDPNFMETLEEINESNSELPEKRGWFDSDADNVFYFSPYMADQKALRVRIPVKHNRYAIEIEHPDDTLFTVGDITPGTRMICTLEWKNIWIIDHSYGYFWTVKSIEIVP
jgi:hypothetical protein